MIFNMTGKNSGGGSIVVSETLDTHGGTIKTITAQNVTNLQTKTITPTTSQQTINPDTGYDGFSQVIVEAGSGGTPTIQSLSVTPTTSQQTFNSSSVDGYKPVTVAAMPTLTLPTSASSTSTGTSKATIGRSTSDQYINIGTGYNETSAYYKISAVANGSATAPASISGTSASVSTGTNTLTLSKTVSVTPTVSAGYVSSGTAGNSSVSLTANVTTKAAATYHPSTSDQTISASQYLTGAQTIKAVTTTNLTAANIKKDVVVKIGDSTDDDCVTSITGTYEGSGGSSGTSMQTDTAEGAASNASSLTFIGLKGEPTSFYIEVDTNVAVGTPSKIVAVVFDGTNLHGQTVTNTNNAQASYSTAFTKSYSNGTLTITSTDASFVTTDLYFITYAYDGGTVDTVDVQVGSGATSITFTGLEDEPVLWSCIFKSNFSTSNGYQRVMAVGSLNDSNIVGFAMDSQANVNGVYWTASYNNGSFTITSQGTNAGGYFHQPGYYQLTYVYDDGSSGNYQTKSVTYTPSTTQQTATIEADSGYDALKKVNITVNAMTSMTLPTASSAYSSGTLKATITPTSSAQYINIPVGYNSTAQYYTISAASGGGSASIGSKTLTPSNRPTSIQFTSMSGSPKAFTLRCTAAMSRSSNSSYYYVAHIRYNGTNTYGNCWRMSNGNWTNITSGYSFSYSGTTLTITSSGSTTTSPGCFYPGEYELIYIY